MTKKEVPKPTKNPINSGIMLPSNTIEEARAEILWGLFSCFMLVCTGKERSSFFLLFDWWREGCCWFLGFGFFHLFHCAKDVSIILLEAPYTSQTT